MALFYFAWNAGAVAPVNPRASDSSTSVRQSAGEVIARRVSSGASPTRTRATKSRATVVERAALSGRLSRNATSSTRVRTGIVSPTNASRISRSATVTNARVGKNSVLSAGNISRSALVRATALYNDVSKIGSGYANCRESYATCMDQICGQANDTYRRCFCSDRFTQFRDTENALDRAMIMLQQFQDNNLEAVDKSAAEVNAMYSATVGEQAIKRDTSASAKMLSEINDLLSGKSSSKTSSSSNSIGVLDLNFSTDMDDIWSGDASSLFSSSEQDLSALEGTALFSAAQKQCSRLSQSSCENDAVFSMSKSSYNILITQDCNAYEKNIAKKRETVAQAIRTAEKYLREARLEEYRSHNSADVNECVAKVRSAILADTACGEDYKRCLDPTGAYINGATGEPIYSPRLFQLENTIVLDGANSSGNFNADVLGANQAYDKFLENYRKYVTRELDTCRDVADFVWTEFKRSALIEIAQAQSAKIEEVKMSCVSIMGECYDTQTQALKDFDKDTATAAGALGRYTARDMCREKVVACAALYGNNSEQECKFDSRGHLTGDSSGCGLASLINYVKAVDSLNVVEKCSDAIDEYVEKLCTPSDNSTEFPYQCKGMLPYYLEENNMSLPYVVQKYAYDNCHDVADKDEVNYSKLPLGVRTRVESAIADVRSGVRASLSEICEELDGFWYPSTDRADGTGVVKPVDSEIGSKPLSKFYDQVSGRGTGDSTIENWGKCYENTIKLECLGYNSPDSTDGDVAKWNATTEDCEFDDSWYKSRCEDVGGYYEGSVCYIR